MSLVQGPLDPTVSSLPAKSAPAASSTASRRRAPSLRKLLPLIGCIVLVVVLSRLDSAALAKAFGRVTWVTVASAAGFFSFNIWLKVLRWQRLLHAQSIELPHRVALPAMLSAQFYAQVTVGRVGEFLRAEALTERGVRVGTALSACVFDRLLDVVCVLFTGLTLGAIWLGQLRAALVAGTLMLTVLVGAVVLFQVFGRDEPPALGGLSARFRFVAGGAGFVHELARGMRPMLRPRAFAETAAWTVVAWYFYFAALFALADGLHIEVSRILLTATAAFAGLSSLLPVTISGLGARELIYIEVLSARGVPSELAVALSLLHLGVMTVSAIVLGLIGVAVRARQRSARDQAHQSA